MCARFLCTAHTNDLNRTPCASILIGTSPVAANNKEARTMAYSLFEPDPPDHASGLLNKLKKYVLNPSGTEEQADTAGPGSTEQTFGPQQMDARQRQIFLKTVFEIAPVGANTNPD